MKRTLWILLITGLMISACAAGPVATVINQAISPADEGRPPEIQSTAPATLAGPAAEINTQGQILEDHSQGIDCLICDQVDLSAYSGPLTTKEVEGLLLALNDEYHAWAVYDQVLQDFGEVNPFANIRRSEATHIDALIDLFNSYNVPIPENAWIGNVGSYPSITQACETGVEAEVLNRDLYTRLFSTTDRQDIISAYTALQQASDEKHLPAFERCSNSGGGAGQGNGGIRGPRWQ